MTSFVSQEVQLPGQDYGDYLTIAEKYARRHGADPETASDIAQTIGMKIFIHGGVPHPEDGNYNPAGYVTRATQNFMISASRKNIDTFPRDEQALETTAEPAPSTEDEWMKRALSPEIEHVMRSLSPQHREILLLDASGYSYQEIADTLGVALGTVQSRLHRARHNAVALLDNRGDL